MPKRRDPHPAPAVPDALPEPAENSAETALIRRLEQACSARRIPPPQVIRAEHVALLTADLPVRGTRQRLAALPFALEDRIAAPLERVHVALGPSAVVPDAPRRVLAAVLARDVMAGAMAPEAGQGPVLAETLGVPAPPLDAGTGAAAWAVWGMGERCVVRVSDGTGFAVSAAMLPLIWARAGRPALTRLAAPLPGDLPCTDLSGDPPGVAPADLGFDLAQGAFARGGGGWTRAAVTLGWAAGLAALAHLGLMTADRIALGRIAASERAAAQAAIAPLLPGITVTPDPAPLLARLAPAAPVQRRSAFLPLLAQVSEVMLEQGGQTALRRMGFDGTTAQLSLLIEAADLAALQALEQALSGAGFDVQSGAATATEGAAQAEFRISGGGRG